MKNESLVSLYEKQRAEYALQCVLEANRDENLAKDYRSYSRKLPQMILTNGFAQTVAFIFSKKGSTSKAYDLIYQQLSEYFENHSLIIEKKEKGTDLLEWVISLDSNKYSLAKEEALELLSWIKRIATGMIDIETEE